jgi:hypothetical protein
VAAVISGQSQISNLKIRGVSGSSRIQRGAEAPRFRL